LSSILHPVEKWILIRQFNPFFLVQNVAFQILGTRVKYTITLPCPRPTFMDNTAVLYHWWETTWYILYGRMYFPRGSLSVPICSRWGGAFGIIMGPPCLVLCDDVNLRLKEYVGRKLAVQIWNWDLHRENHPCSLCLLVLFCCGLLCGKITIQFCGSWFRRLILWRICSKQELWSQRNSRCYVMPARDNTGNVTIRVVTRTAVAMKQMSKHFSAETNSRNNRRAVFCAVRTEGLKKDKEVPSYNERTKHSICK
jgi:hypothetical protein